ncbi:MAG: lipopolysaccharide kinase InaA family protein [bacterium]
MHITNHYLKINTQLILQNSRQNILNKSLTKDVLCFTGNSLQIGQCPNDLQNIDFSKLNTKSDGVIGVNEIGYLAEILKYSPVKSRNIYAIKRVWAPEKAKHQTANPIEQLKTEAQVYEKIKGFKNIPEFYFYNGDFGKSTKAQLNNYLVMGWVDGKQASSKGIFYDHALITNKKISKIFNLIEKFDEVGVIHNDLWAGNILFSKNNVNIIDFNRSYLVNPLTTKENNLIVFKERFLNRYFSDLFHRKGEQAFLDSYQKSLHLEVDYYKNKTKFYKKNNSIENTKLCFEKINELKNILKNPDLLKQKAIKTVFDTDNRCADIYAKYFEFDNYEADFHYKKALNVLKKYPEILGTDKINVLESNIKLTSNLKRFIESNSNSDNLSNIENIDKSLLLLNKNVYSKTERKKLYYIKYLQFCELHKKLESGENINNLKETYKDLLVVRTLKKHFSKFLKNQDGH